jgi:hypothetical protein
MFKASVLISYRYIDGQRILVGLAALDPAYDGSSTKGIEYPQIAGLVQCRLWRAALG